MEDYSSPYKKGGPSARASSGWKEGKKISKRGKGLNNLPTYKDKKKLVNKRRKKINTRAGGKFYSGLLRGAGLNIKEFFTEQ